MKKLSLNTKLAQSLPLDLIEKPKDLSSLQCSMIFNNIYLSGFNSALDEQLLSKIGITHVLNCAVGSKNFKTKLFQNVKYLLLELKDQPGFDLIHSIYLTIEFIENLINQGGKLLIHCSEVNFS